MRRKGAQLLGGFDQPVQHGIGIDLEDAGGGADTSPLSQAGHNPYDQLDWGLFAVEDRAMRLQKVPRASRTVALAPRAAAGMAIAPQMAQPQPAPIGTIAVRTKVHGGVALTGASVRHRHRLGTHQRPWRACAGCLFPEGAMRFVGEALKGFRLARAV